MLHQPIRHLHHLARRHRQPRRRRQSRRNQLIRQHPQMLRIVLKLHHPQLPIRPQHQLALRPTPHSPNRLHRQHRQPTHLAQRRTLNPALSLSPAPITVPTPSPPAPPAPPPSPSGSRHAPHSPPPSARLQTLTNVLHSPSSLREKNIHGDSTSKAPIRLTIPGFDPAVVNHPATPSRPDQTFAYRSVASR